MFEVDLFPTGERSRLLPPPSQSDRPSSALLGPGVDTRPLPTHHHAHNPDAQAQLWLLHAARRLGVRHPLLAGPHIDLRQR